LLSEQRYLPFGEVRSDVAGIDQTDLGYTSQRQVAGLGLMDYRARMYDPGLGRFVQADAISPDYSVPPGLNRFAYVNNDPIRYTDMSGHRLDEGCGSGSVCELPPPSSDDVTIKIPGFVIFEIHSPGTNPRMPRSEQQLIEAENWAALGAFLDLVEMGAAASLIDLIILEWFVSIVDIGVTWLACSNYGECGLSPQGTLILNQDMIITLTDFTLPLLLGGGFALPTAGMGFVPTFMITDIVTSMFSFGYDLSRITGQIPNFISIELPLPFYSENDLTIHVYP